MPMMELTFPTGALTARAKDTLPGDLVTILLAAEKAPNTDVVRSLPAEDSGCLVTIGPFEKSVETKRPCATALWTMTGIAAPELPPARRRP